ncbi:MAG: Ig-like domain-containing protein [Gammaproteobacteria bacterium]|nr:Ig-like domain-containing protein [Gammaproteobacteria bacterium]
MKTGLSGTVLLWLIFLVACGGASPNFGDKTGDAKQIALIASSYPLNGDQNVPVRTTQITVSFAIDIAPETVSQENIHLMPGEGSNMHILTSTGEEISSEFYDRKDMISGHVFYSPADRTLTFRPASPLEHGTTYHIHIQNLKQLDGSPLATGADTVQFSFTTEHRMLERVNFYTKDDNDADIINAWREFSYRGDKSLEKETIIKASGKINTVTVYSQLMPGGAFAKAIVYEGNQESIAHYTMEVKDEFGNVVGEGRIVDPGPDGVWGNSDDLLNRYTRYTHHHNSHTEVSVFRVADRLQQIGITSAPWSQRETSFEITISYLIEQNGPLFEHRTIFYSDLGIENKIDLDKNGNPAPVDDVVTGWRKRDFNNDSGLRTHLWTLQGNFDSELKRKTPELSEALFTENNKVMHMTNYEYIPLSINPSQSLLIKSSNFDGPGDDKDWLTYQDNHVISYEEYEYDVNGYLQKQKVYHVSDEGVANLKQEYIYKVY